MRIEFDGGKTAACQVVRIKPATAPAAVALLARLAQHEDAALPPDFADTHPGHAALLSYLAAAPAGHWHLGLSPAPTDRQMPPGASTQHQDKIRPLHSAPTGPLVTKKPGSDALLGLVSGFLVPDPLAQGSSDTPGLIDAPAAPALFVNSLIVRQDQRQLGYGSRALDLIGKLAAAKGAKRAYVAISVHNPAARDFYRRQGASPCDLCYWSLADEALNSALHSLQDAPTPLYRSQPAAGPGLQSLRGLAGPPLDLGFGFDFGLARYEAWLQMDARWSPQELAISHATALRQLMLWLHDQPAAALSQQPRLGITGLAANLPDHCDPVEANVWMLPLGGRP